MAHSKNVNDFLASITPCLISISSEFAVKLYEEKIKPALNAIQNSQTALQVLVNDSEKIIEKFASEPDSTYTHKKDSKESSVQLDKVMLAMLECAEGCGGEDGKRYVASAIVACSREENTIEALVALGTTWLTHLLFTFKTNRRPTETPFEITTPTIKSTATYLLNGVGYRQRSFQDDVLARDGYTCVVTGFQDRKRHPKRDKSIPGVNLVCAHILPMAISEFDRKFDSESFMSVSVMTTFDILRNITRLPIQTLEELHNKLDDPSNGITLQKDANDGFDDFHWCLKPTEEKDVYETKIFVDRWPHMPENNRISFKDHSNDFSLNSTCKRSRPMELPDPLYIAIHAAIAGVLNMSGAGNFFDELLDKYRDNEGDIPPVRSWPEFEMLMGKELLRESIFKGIQ